jgi:hypothetical protein
MVNRMRVRPLGGAIAVAMSPGSADGPGGRGGVVYLVVVVVVVVAVVVVVLLLVAERHKLLARR